MSSQKGLDTVQVSGNVVIDGNSLCYYLHSKPDWQLGGEYKEFYETVTDSINIIVGYVHAHLYNT